MSQILELEIQRLHSRDQLCKFPKKKAFAQERNSNPKGLVWDTNMAVVSFFWNNNIADVMLSDNAP